MIRIGVAARVWPGRLDALGSQRESALVMPLALAQMLHRFGAIALLLPYLDETQIEVCVQELDGLVLQGGSDLAPELYGEAPLHGQSLGDVEGNKVEISLFRHFIHARKPVLGFCRGCQLINIAFGGSLHQDLPQQLGNAQIHSDPNRYVALEHDVKFVHGSYLQKLYGRDRSRVNSAHHQGIHRLGAELEAQAHSVKDGLIEALRWRGDSYVVGVQWHPEFLLAEDTSSLDGTILFGDFVAQAQRRRNS